MVNERNNKPKIVLESPEFEAYRRVLPTVTLEGGRSKLRFLKMLAQTCDVTAEAHQEMVRSLEIDESRLVDEHRLSMTAWLENRQRLAGSRCDKCGMSILPGKAPCPHCGNESLPGRPRHLIEICSETADRLRRLPRGFGAIGTALVVITVIAWSAAILAYFWMT